MFKSSIQSFVKKIFASHANGQLKVYQKAQHAIDRRLVSRNAIKVCEALQKKGFQAYIVGGAVRDLILGVQPKDFDVATNANLEQITASLRRSRIIGRRFRLVHAYFGEEIIEVSTFRAPSLDNEEKTDEYGRILSDNVWGTLEQDAYRRDFTLNALYYDPSKEEVLDFHQGFQDIKNARVKIIGHPETRYREDPVRILRAVRFTAKLNFTLEKSTQQAIPTVIALLANIPKSRLFDESLKLLSCGNAIACIQQLQALQLPQGILPILDLITQQINHNKLLAIALERTDHRVRSNKHINPSFLFTCILWAELKSLWDKKQAQGENTIPALANAAHDIIEKYVRPLNLQRRHSAEMREIWFMQPRFEKRNPKSAYRLIGQARFRAAVDFLQIRAAASEVDSVFAQWWLDFADAPQEQRQSMLEQTPNQPKLAKVTRQKKSRRRHSGKKRWAEKNQDMSKPISPT